MEINEAIRDKEVRLIGADGSQLGIVPVRDALRRAEEKERGSEKAEEAGGDKRCPSVPYGHEMGLETGGTYHRSSQIQKDSSSCGRLL